MQNTWNWRSAQPWSLSDAWWITPACQPSHRWISWSPSSWYGDLQHHDLREDGTWWQLWKQGDFLPPDVPGYFSVNFQQPSHKIVVGGWYGLMLQHQKCDGKAWGISVSGAICSLCVFIFGQPQKSSKVESNSTSHADSEWQTANYWLTGHYWTRRRAIHDCRPRYCPFRNASSDIWRSMGLPTLVSPLTAPSVALAANGKCHVCADLHLKTPQGGQRVWIDWSSILTGFCRINLPKELKMQKPRYQDYQAENIQDVEGEDVKVRVMAGTYKGVTGPVVIQNPSMLMDVQLKPGGIFEQPVSTPLLDLGGLPRNIALNACYAVLCCAVLIYTRLAITFDALRRLLIDYQSRISETLWSNLLSMLQIDSDWNGFAYVSNGSGKIGGTKGKKEQALVLGKGNLVTASTDDPEGLRQGVLSYYEICS